MQASVFGTRDAALRAGLKRLCDLLSRDFATEDRFPEVACVNIIFVGNARIRELNRRFLKRDRPTDVIAFDGDRAELRHENGGCTENRGLSPPFSPPGEPRLLGEVYVSRDQARIQAREFGVPYSLELRRLVLHGLLHLLGLTHKQMEPYYRKYLTTKYPVPRSQ
jgi:probable rRNA maturation factor